MSKRSRSQDLDDIIANIVRPAAAGIDQSGQFPRPAIDALGGAGFLGLTVPLTDGGFEASSTEVADVVFRLAKACASTAMVYVMHLTSLNAILQVTDVRQRSLYLEPVIDGHWLVTEAISEPGSGSQWWSVSSTASTSDSGYQIDADKSFVTSAGNADLYIVSTRAPDSMDSHDHALFAVPSDSKGLTTGQWNGLGLAGNSSATFSFHGEVGQDALLMAGGGGLRRYNEINQPAYHLGIGAAYLGIATAAYDECVGRIRSRTYVENITGHGTKLSSYPVTRRHIGQMAIRLAAIRAMVERLAQTIDSGCAFEDLAIEMTVLKVAAAEAAVDVTREAMMASGGSAYVKGLLTIERHMRDALAGSLMGPNDDFCKELIGRLELEDGSYHEL